MKLIRISQLIYEKSQELEDFYELNVNQILKIKVLFKLEDWK